MEAGKFSFQTGMKCLAKAAKAAKVEEELQSNWKKTLGFRLPFLRSLRCLRETTPLIQKHRLPKPLPDCTLSAA